MSAVTTEARLTPPTEPPAKLPRIRPPRVRPAIRPSSRRALGSVPFVLLIFALLAGGLVTLLMVNNTLAAGSFEQSRLRADLILLGEQEQALKQEVERASSPTQLRAAAKLLGMVPSATTTYVDPLTGTIWGTPIASGAAVPLAPGTVPPGSTPQAMVPPGTAPTPTADGAGADATPGVPSGTDSATPLGGPSSAVGGDGARTEPPTTAYDRAIVSGGGR